MSRKSRASPPSPFRRFNSSPEVIRLVVFIYVRFSLSLRNVDNLLFERGIDSCHEMVRLWWNRFGPLFAGDVRCQQVSRMRGFWHWLWHLTDQKNDKNEAGDAVGGAEGGADVGGPGNILGGVQTSNENDGEIERRQN